MKYLLMLLLVGMVGCGTREYQPNGVSIAVMNNCEYVVYRDFNGVAMVHAGNCKNQEHKADTTQMGYDKSAIIALDYLMNPKVSNPYDGTSPHK